jgi:hypothetical protein
MIITSGARVDLSRTKQRNFLNVYFSCNLRLDALWLVHVLLPRQKPLVYTLDFTPHEPKKALILSRAPTIVWHQNYRRLNHVAFQSILDQSKLKYLVQKL